MNGDGRLLFSTIIWDTMASVRDQPFIKSDEVGRLVESLFKVRRCRHKLHAQVCCFCGNGCCLFLLECWATIALRAAAHRLRQSVSQGDGRSVYKRIVVSRPSEWSDLSVFADCTRVAGNFWEVFTQIGEHAASYRTSTRYIGIPS